MGRSRKDKNKNLEFNRVGVAPPSYTVSLGVLLELVSSGKLDPVLEPKLLRGPGLCETLDGSLLLWDEPVQLVLDGVLEGVHVG